MTDVTVIGAGVAGCAAARRLSDDPGVLVTLLEAGSLTGRPDMRAPSARPSLTGGDRDCAPTSAPPDLGGKTPPLVSADADLDLVVPTPIAAGTLMNGQFCVTGSRILVERSDTDRLREARKALRPARHRGVPGIDGVRRGSTVGVGLVHGRRSSALMRRRALFPLCGPW